MSSVVLYLIRHGKTHCNEKRLYCGREDVSLSNGGIDELKERVNNIKHPNCRLNYTSGAKRANETFEILFPNIEYSHKNEFWEFDFGDFELKSYEELKENKDYINWICDKTGKVKCPNGESKDIFNKRLEKGFRNLIKEIQEEKEESALIVCHGGTIGTILERYYDNKRSFYEYQPRCGGGYKLKVTVESEVEIEILEEF